MKQKSGNPSSQFAVGQANLASPQYPIDDGLPTQIQMEAIARLTAQDVSTTTLSSLFETNHSSK